MPYRNGMRCRSFPLLVAVLLLYTSMAESVEQSKFKTCSQSGFCRRNRALTPGGTDYVVSPDSVKCVDSKLEAVLLNTKENVSFTLLAEVLKGGVMRLRISEVSTLAQRYQVVEALIGDPQLSGGSAPTRDKAFCSFPLSEGDIVVNFKPFRLTYIVNGSPVVILNSRGLLNIEHYRPKNADHKPEEDSPADENQGSSTSGKTEDAYWEETFGTWTDSKPRGPSSVAVDVSFVNFKNVYGIPEHADSFSLKSTKDGEPYRLYNLDVFEYDLDSRMAIYGSVPYMIAHSSQRTVGFFWMNAAETWVDITKSTSTLSSILSIFGTSSQVPEVETHWISESGILDAFILTGPTPHDVFKQYASLTGTQQLVPLFSLAYHQCRWNYNDEADVRGVDANFDTHDIPYDVIWLDIEHTDGKRYFTWDYTKFPEPRKMVDDIAAKGRKMVTIVDPHIKRDSGYGIYKEASSLGYFIKSKDNTEYDGWCWPGSSSYPDFVNPTIRDWWSSKFLLENYPGSSLSLFTWNDMNEPSVFNGPEITMPKDNLHYGNWEHRDVHNLYGMLVHMSTFKGHLLRSEHKLRPFILSRSFYAGSQRYGAVWTGDNKAEWSHLQASIPMLLSISAVGISLIGADIGGFFGNPEPELMVRWYQAASYQPFFRSHAHIDTKRREPWLFGEENKALFRDAIRQRYSLLPYWYTLFYEAHRTGHPVMRALWMEYPRDEKTFDLEDQYLIGTDLLVKPIVSSGTWHTDCYFPGSESWYDVITYQKYEGGRSFSVDAPLSKIPVFQRGGSILIRKNRIRRASSLMQHDPVNIYIAVDSKGNAGGRLYLDDGESTDHETKNSFLVVDFHFEGNRLTSTLAPESGNYVTSSVVERVVIIGLKDAPTSATLHVGEQATSVDVVSAPGGVLILRNPRANVGQPFSILL